MLRQSDGVGLRIPRSSWLSTRSIEASPLSPRVHGSQRMTRFVRVTRYAQRGALVFVAPTVATTLIAQTPSASGRSYVSPPRSSATVNGAGAPVSITIEGGARRMIVGATVPHTARLRDASGAERRDLSVQWTSSDPNVASVN